MNSYPVPKVPSIATVPAGTWLYATSALEPSPDNIQVDPGRDMPYLGQPGSTVRIVEYVDAKGVHQGRSMFAKASDVTAIRPAPDPTPFNQAQLDAAAKAAAAAVKAAADRGRHVRSVTMTDSQPGTILGREPAMVFALVQAVIALVVAFGLNLAPDQIGAILAVTAVVLGLITRSRVNPA